MNDEGGFTLIELLISMCLLLVVSGIVVGATMDLTRLSGTMTNRSDMHAGVRNATALLQQEVGQAGRVSLPGPVTLLAAVGVGVATVQVSSTEGMFVGERLIIGTGVNEETVTVTTLDPDTNSIEARFTLDHIAGARVAATGGFSGGVIPTTIPNGSDGMTLKILGDINANGRMVYVEYRCDLWAGACSATSCRSTIWSSRQSPSSRSCWTIFCPIHRIPTAPFHRASSTINAHSAERRS